MERRRIRRAERGPQPSEWPPTQGAPTPAEPGADVRVRVSWGALTRDVDAGGMTVDEAYHALRGPLNLAPAVRALVNGDEVPGDYVLDAADRVEFVRAAGEKG